MRLGELLQGEVEGIERAEGRTEVLVDEGSSAVQFQSRLPNLPAHFQFDTEDM